MPKSTPFSSRFPTSLTLKLLSRVILEIVDKGFTTRLSITMYVTTPFTYPPSLEDPGLFELGGSTKFSSRLMKFWQEGQIALLLADTYEIQSVL